MAYSVASGSNTFVPSHDATGNLMIGYSRNATKFPLMDYMQIRPVEKNVGLYMKLQSQEAARVLSTDDREHLWADGQDAPHGRDETDGFEYLPYRTKRRAYPFTFGDLSVKQADWPILQVHTKIAAQKMMTARTLIAQTALSSYSWTSIGHQVGVNGGLLADGQGWDNGTETSPNILKSLNEAASLIFRDTIGAVEADDLILVVGVDLAKKMATSQEIHKYLAYGPSAAGRLTGSDPKTFGVNSYGLPNKLYRYKIVVDDVVRISSAKNAAGTATRGFIMPSTEAYLMSRPGGLEGVEGTPAFSTLTGFFYENESTVEIKNDVDNRRTMGRIVSDYDIVLTAPESGVRFSDLLSNDSSGV